MHVVGLHGAKAIEELVGSGAPLTSRKVRLLGRSRGERAQAQLLPGPLDGRKGQRIDEGGGGWACAQLALAVARLAAGVGAASAGAASARAASARAATRPPDSAATSATTAGALVGSSVALLGRHSLL